MPWGAQSALVVVDDASSPSALSSALRRLEIEVRTTPLARIDELRHAPDLAPNTSERSAGRFVFMPLFDDDVVCLARIAEWSRRHERDLVIAHAPEAAPESIAAAMRCGARSVLVGEPNLGAVADAIDAAIPDVQEPNGAPLDDPELDGPDVDDRGSDEAPAERPGTGAASPDEPRDRSDVASHGEAGPGASRARGVVDRLRHEAASGAPREDPHHAAFVAIDPAMRRLLDRALTAAASDAAILVTGPGGSGKTHLARVIHGASSRARGPFIDVPCAALPSHLIESELFGHVEGAFAEATRDRAGRFEVASGGTVFLDEITELPPAAQTRLLAALQERRITRVGESNARPIDVRVVAATDRDLDALVRAGTFREDLLWRLDVVRLEMPPLRERAADIEPLALAFLANLAARTNGVPNELTPRALARLRLYAWPGNVRELENVLERAAIFARDRRIDEGDLEFHAPRGDRSGSVLPSLAGHSLAEIERRLILDTLDAVGWNRAAAARELGISERTIYNKLQLYEAQIDAAETER